MKKIFTLSFIITNAMMFAQTTLPNGGFETWTGTGANMEPTNYHSNKSGTGFATLAGQTCFQDASSVHSGTYSARLETITAVGSSVNGSLTSGIVNAPSFNKVDGYIGTMQGANGTDIRRIPFVGRPDSLIGFYHYTQSTTSTGTGGANEIGKIYAILHLGNYYDPETPTAGNYHPDSTVNKIGSALFLTPANNVNNWTRFAVAFNYVSAATPQYILLNCTPSNNQLTSVAGSKLWLDDLSVVYNSSVGIADNNSIGNTVSVYAYDKNIYVDFINGKDVASSISVFDLTGKLILTRTLNATSNFITAEDLSAGLYLYKVTGKDFSKSGKLTIE